MHDDDAGPSLGPAEELDRLARGAGDDPAELRREVSRFRLALDADLAVAAAAVDADAPEIAADVIDQERQAVRAFAGRLLARVGDAQSARAPAPRPGAGHRHAGRRSGGAGRHLAAGPRTVAVAIAAVLVGAAGGAALAVQSSSSPAHPAAPSPALGANGVAPAGTEGESPAQRLASAQAGVLAYAASKRLSPAMITSAADALRATVQPLLGEAAHNPGVARQLWQLLSAEETSLRASDLSIPAVAAALNSMAMMLAQLAATVPASVLLGLTPTAVATVVSAPARPAPTRTVAATPTTVPSPHATAGSSSGSPASATTAPSGPSLLLPSPDRSGASLPFTVG
jgi:hypothetical protein